MFTDKIEKVWTVVDLGSMVELDNLVLTTYEYVSSVEPGTTIVGLKFYIRYLVL